MAGNALFIAESEKKFRVKGSAPLTRSLLLQGFAPLPFTANAKVYDRQ